MNIDEIYQKIIKEIDLGHRALNRFSPEELENLNQLLLSAFEKRDLPQLEKLLCLVDHSSALYGKFEEVLLKALNSDLPSTHLVFALNCSRRHIILARFQKGHRLEFSFLEALKKLLHSRSPEVVEWTLRTIEECSNQGVYFLQEFDKIKPAPWKWFNSHQRAVREIIAMLERRWSPSEKSKS